MGDGDRDSAAARRIVGGISISAVAQNPAALIVVALSAAVATAAFHFPGQMDPDAADQYRQVLTGRVTDWHPPIMARLWAALARFAPGPGPMLLAQVALLWLGLWAVADRLARDGHGKVALLVLASGLNPFILHFIGFILKDAMLGSALIAAFGLVYRAGRETGWFIAAPVILLLLYGMLVRSNAVFALPPLLLYATGLDRRLGNAAKALAFAGFVALAIPAASLVNHQLLGAERTGVERSLLLFDLAGIAHFSGDRGRFTQLLEQPGCYTPLFWDSLETARCGDPFWRMAEQPGTTSRLAREWLGEVAEHPLAYAAHRVAHFNSATFFLVPPLHQCVEAPEVHRCPPQITLRDQVLDLLKKNTFFWPACWLGLGLSLFLAARRAPPSAHNAGVRALLASALLYGFGFLVVGVASDLRYFFWPVVAIQLALLLLAADRQLSWRILWLPGALAAASYAFRLWSMAA